VSSKPQVINLNRPTPGEVSSRELAVLFAVDLLRLGEIGVGVLHEFRLGLIVAEAVGLALDGGIDRAIGLHLFAVGKAPAAHIVPVAAMAAVAMPSANAPASADVTIFLIMVHFLGVRP